MKNETKLDYLIEYNIRALAKKTKIARVVGDDAVCPVCLMTSKVDRKKYYECAYCGNDFKIRK